MGIGKAPSAKTCPPKSGPLDPPVVLLTENGRQRRSHGGVLGILGSPGSLTGPKHIWAPGGR